MCYCVIFNELEGFFGNIILNKRKLGIGNFKECSVFNEPGTCWDHIKGGMSSDIEGAVIPWGYGNRIDDSCQS